MTDDFVEKLQELARRDAQKGVGMSQEAINLCHAQMSKYVSPDRSAPIAQMTQKLQKAEKAHKGEDPTLEFLDRMLAQLKGKGRPERIVKSFSGLAGGCSGDLHSTPENQVATVYSPDGEEIAQYNTSGGGWMNLTTKGKISFLGIPVLFISKLGMLRVRRSRMQRRNNQWLAKVKLRLSMFGPEIITITE